MPQSSLLLTLLVVVLAATSLGECIRSAIPG